MITARVVLYWLAHHSPALLGRFVRHGVVPSWRALRIWRSTPPAHRLPPFLFIAVTNDCQLRCLGCWVTPTDPPRAIPPDVLDRMIHTWKRHGARWIGILGGEPLRYEPLDWVLARHPDVYFQVFTNGWDLNDERARRFQALGNVSPLISFEGVATAADQRRGAVRVADRTWSAVQAARRAGLITGIATSLCRSNWQDLLGDDLLSKFQRAGVAYVWYYIYRPVGPRPAPELALSEPEIRAVRERILEIRRCWPFLVVDSYWDEEGRALCAAASGLSCHINPEGAIEPCPLIQLSDVDIGDGSQVVEALRRSRLLSETRRRLSSLQGGCVLLAHPALLSDLAQLPGVRDSSGRGTFPAEALRPEPMPDHKLDPPIPETTAFYRSLKRWLFFGLGSYG